MSDALPGPEVVVASAGDAAGMVEVIHAAFGNRPVLDPPSTASAETADSVAGSLRRGAGIYAHVGGRPAGSILVALDPRGFATFSRVSVHPDFQRHGIASAMVHAAEGLAARRGARRLELFARNELTDLIDFWYNRGFVRDRSAPHGVVLIKPLPVAVSAPTAADMRAVGARLADLLRAGDVVVLTGEVGAGKTTLTQGLGAGLGATTPILSPTFVLSRVHRSATDRPTLIHVDAYRLASAAELDDLDLDATAADAVTVMEWGKGLVEELWPERLEIDIERSPVTGSSPEDADEGRTLLLRPVGRRWSEADLTVLQHLRPGCGRAADG